MPKKYNQSESKGVYKNSVDLEEESYPSEEENKFEHSEEKETEPEEEAKMDEASEVTLIFKENRSFELHIGRAIYRFEGRESKKVPASVLGHKDFTESISKKFVIRKEN